MIKVDIVNEVSKVADITKVKAEVANLDSVDRRLTLTMRAPGESPEAEQVQALKRERSGKGATLGDVLKEKLESIKKTPSQAPPPPEPEPAPAADAESGDEES